MKTEKIVEFVKVSISSIVSSAVDLGFFYLLCRNNTDLYTIITATIIARIASGIVNFLINKYWAFESTGKTKKEIILFTILFIVKIAISSLLVWLLRDTSINQTLLKAIIDFLLFFGSYIIQKNFIFLNDNQIKKN